MFLLPILLHQQDNRIIVPRGLPSSFWSFHLKSFFLWTFLLLHFTQCRVTTSLSLVKPWQDPLFYLKSDAQASISEGWIWRLFWQGRKIMALCDWAQLTRWHGSVRNMAQVWPYEDEQLHAPSLLASLSTDFWNLVGWWGLRGEVACPRGLNSNWRLFR